MINKALKNLKVHSGNDVSDSETQFREWKVQLTMSINFISSIYSDEIRNKHTKRNNIETMVGSETDEIIEELFESLLQIYQDGLEKSMKESDFTFDSVNLLHYHLQKVGLKRIGSLYVDSPEWLKNKKAAVNSKK